MVSKVTEWGAECIGLSGGIADPHKNRGLLGRWAGNDCERGTLRHLAQREEWA